MNRVKTELLDNWHEDWNQYHNSRGRVHNHTDKEQEGLNYQHNNIFVAADGGNASGDGLRDLRNGKIPAENAAHPAYNKDSTTGNCSAYKDLG